MGERVVTVERAAELSGLTPKAIRRRVERGSLAAVVRDGRRMIPVAELLRAELVAAGDDGELRSAHASTPPGAPHGESAALVAELVARIDAQGRELGEARAELRALPARVDAERQAREAAEAELHEARAAVRRAEAEAAELRERLVEHERPRGVLSWWRALGRRDAEPEAG